MPKSITSLQNPRVKAAMRLRDGRHRQKQQRILIDGVREVRLALTAGLAWEDVFICPKLLTDSELADELQTTSAVLWKVSEPVFEKLAYGGRSEGVVATAVVPERPLSAIEPGDCPLIVVLEGVEKPGNVGAVFRTADAAGADAVILADPRTDLFNPNAIRASLGTVFSMPSAVAASREVLDWLTDRGVRPFAAWVDAEASYTDSNLIEPAAVILGSEAHGLSDTWRAGDVTRIHLPMHGQADSLNVSTSAAVLLYESVRQRSNDA